MHMPASVVLPEYVTYLIKPFSNDTKLLPPKKSTGNHVDPIHTAIEAKSEAAKKTRMSANRRKRLNNIRCHQRESASQQIAHAYDTTQKRSIFVT
jgi:hypothetical protein